LDPTSDIATARDAGSNCPYCRFTFKQGVGLLRCPACSAAHHDDCWSDNGGCAVVGCRAAPDAAPAHAAAGRPPPIAAAPAAPPPPPGAAPPHAATGRARSALGANALAIGLIALAVVVAIAAASVALFGSSGDSSAPERGGSPGTQAGTDDGGDDTPAPRPVHKQAIVAVLRRYATAYTNHDTDNLRFVFTPDVTRHGLAPGGCRDASGRAAVLLQYRGQFDLGTGAYTLHGLGPGAITVDGTSASTDLDYSIEGGRNGRISFELARFAGVWRVSHVDTHC
jgi:hypothetical protein